MAAVWLALLLGVGYADGGSRAGAATPEIADARALQTAFEEVAAQIAPSVVAVHVERAAGPVVIRANDDSQDGGASTSVLVNGTGIVIRPEGFILTNEHVVQDALKIVVVMYDGKHLPATLVQADRRGDLAILRVAKRDLQPMRMARWDHVARGQWAIVLGNPYGLGADGQASVAVGIISNLERRLPGLGAEDDRLYHDMIQTTAAIHPGYSGGPLVNLRGELVGLVTAMHTRTAAEDGVGFAIPMKPEVVTRINELCTGRPVAYGFVGVTARSLNEQELAVVHHNAVAVGALEPDGPAARAGLRIGDVVLGVNGQTLRGPSHFAYLVGQLPVGAAARLAILRDRLQIELEVEVEPRETQRVARLQQRYYYAE